MGTLLTVLVDAHEDSFSVDIENGKMFDLIENKHLKNEVREIVGKNVIRILQEDYSMQEGEEETVIAMQLISKLAWRGGEDYTVTVLNEGMAPFDDEYLQSRLSQEDYKEYKQLTDTVVDEITNVLGEYYGKVLHYVVDTDE